MKWVYLHTLDGKPAYFADGYVWFASISANIKRPQPLALSLKQIRREQRQSQENRTRDGFIGGFCYGYIRLTLPGESP